MVAETPTFTAHASHMAFRRTGSSTSVLGVLTLHLV